MEGLRAAAPLLLLLRLDITLDFAMIKEGHNCVERVLMEDERSRTMMLGAGQRRDVEWTDRGWLLFEMQDD